MSERPPHASGGWRALALVCAYAVASSTNYTSQGPLLGFIAADFGLASVEVGYVATAFFFGATYPMLVGGVLADRFGPRPVLTVSFGIAAVCALAGGLYAPTYAWLLAWRVLSGTGAGIAFAAGSSYTRGVFRQRGPHLAQGLFGAAFLFGSGITLLYVPWLLGPDGDWRRASALSSLVLIVVWLAWTFFAPAGPPPVAATRSGGFGSAVRSRNAWLLGLCHMCGFGLAMLISTWATTYFQRSFGVSLALAGALGSLLPVTGIATRALGGVVLERGVSPLVLIRGSLVAAIAGLVLMSWMAASGAGWAMAVAASGLLLVGVGVGLPYASVFNGAAASVADGPASAQAIVGMAGGSVTIFGPPLLGALLDASGSFASGMAVLAAFVALVLLATRWLLPFQLGVAAAPMLLAGSRTGT